jgi:hypothetical protein
MLKKNPSERPTLGDLMTYDWVHGEDPTAADISNEIKKVK